MTRNVLQGSGQLLLSDGSPVSGLIDHQSREISPRVFTDPDIYELELERIWAKAWILVGHDSEIPQAGDYVTRTVGEDSVIVVRQRDGTIACLLNVCPHRGMQVCRNEFGRATVFKCIYHGWTFNQDGGLRGAPFDNEIYPDGFDREARALFAARVEIFGGLIFMNWSRAAPTLDEYFGEIGSYLRTLFDRTERGFEVIGAPQRYVIKANWKTAAEQAAGDGYHGVSLHRSLVDLGVMGAVGTDAKSWGLYSFKVSANGHGFKFHNLRELFPSPEKDRPGMTPTEKLRVTPPAGMPAELVDEFVARFDGAEMEAFADIRPGVGALFPNVHIVAMSALDPAGGMASSFGIHTFVPKGPGEFEFVHWNFVERGASDAFRERILRTSTFNTGASGVIEQDDSAVWPAMQRSARGFMGRAVTLKYHASSQPAKPSDWVGGGEIYSGINTDDNQWNWWKLYFQYLTAETEEAR